MKAFAIVVALLLVPVQGYAGPALADRDFKEVDLPDLPDTSPAEITEGIQHGIFRGFSGPVMLFGLVSVLAKSMGDKDGSAEEDDHE